MVPKHIIRVVRRHLSTSTIASPCSNIPICPHTIFSKNPFLKGNNEFKDWSNIKTLNLLKNAQIIGNIVKLNCLRIRIRWKPYTKDIRCLPFSSHTFSQTIVPVELNFRGKIAYDPGIVSSQNNGGKSDLKSSEHLNLDMLIMKWHIC